VVTVTPRPTGVPKTTASDGAAPMPRLEAGTAGFTLLVGAVGSIPRGMLIFLS
jgi:hypothetical protein